MKEAVHDRDRWQKYNGGENSQREDMPEEEVILLFITFYYEKNVLNHKEAFVS